MSAATASAAPSKGRIASLDQYRGYAIFGMLLVNFFGHYDTKWVQIMEASWLKDALQWIFGVQLHHHGEYMTYADTIAPIFMFVVGIGMRLSWTRRVQHVEPGQARKAMAKRYFTLVLIAFAIYTGWLWDALMNIGLAGLVALLIVDKKWYVRVAYALGLLVAYQLIFSNTSYGEWLLRMGKYGRDLDWPFITTFIPLRGDLLSVQINGGLIGHWGWATMLIFGTIAYDIMATRDSKKIVSGLLGMGLLLTVAGWGARAVGTKAYYAEAEPYAAACMLEGDLGPASRIVSKSPGIFSSHVAGNAEAEAALKARDLKKLTELMKPELEALAANKPETPPRTANEWVFSKNYVTMPFAFWATALCVFHLLGFYIVCDLLKINIPGMEVIGMNPLFIYIFQSLTLEIYSNIVDLAGIEETESGLIVLGSFVVYFGLIYAMALYFYKKKIIIKL
jgi:predicted acyltransferase